MVALAKLPAGLSVEEFFDWAAASPGKWELVDGEPHAMAPPSRSHGMLQVELGSLIRNHLLAIGSPCSVLAEPGIVPHVGAAHNFRIPDLGVTCSSYTEEEYAITDPVLLIEILSPSNEAATRANIWTYTTIPSVREIVALHSTSIGAEILRRGIDGIWPKKPEVIDAGDLVLDSIGFRVPLADVYRTTRLRPAS